MKYLLYITFFFAGVSFSNAQRTLVFQDVEKDQDKGNFGPNRKHYFHFYSGYGFLAQQSESGSEIIFGSSGEFEFGVRYKSALNRHFSVGFDAAYRARGFKLDQVASKTFVNSAINDFEKLRFYEADFSVYERITFGKIGNHIGKFWDVGGFVSTPMLVTMTTINEMSNGNKVINQVRRLNYINPYNYGLITRVGFGRYVVWGRYRLSDQFDSSYGYGEMGRISAGIQIGFHK